MCAWDSNGYCLLGEIRRVGCEVGMVYAVGPSRVGKREGRGVLGEEVGRGVSQDTVLPRELWQVVIVVRYGQSAQY